MFEILKLVIGKLATNCYVVRVPELGCCVVIDPGGEGKRILERTRELECTVSHILLTHGHIDHTLAIPDLKQAFPEVQVVVHDLDAPMLKDPVDSLGIWSGLPHQAIEADVLLKVGDKVESQRQTVFINEGLTFEIIETPGHTPGGVCYYLPLLPRNAVDKANERSDLTGAGTSIRVRSDLLEVVAVRKKGGALFSGDTLFRRSIGRTDLPGGDYQQELRSIKEKLLALPPETIVYPGHGSETTIGEEAAHNPFLV